MWIIYIIYLILSNEDDNMELVLFTGTSYHTEMNTEEVNSLIKNSIVDVKINKNRDLIKL